MSTFQLLMKVRYELIPPDQGIVIEKARFTFFPLRKAFEKKLKQLKIKGKSK